ncbi:MAG: gliding motility-associated C-terminal domain-containing protein [Owenweeksia sp.]|nr:gliding motility-associated C-terminal domain-containing protein [Owenweeksia sp.]
MRRILTLLLITASVNVLHATHNRAGEITYSWVSGNTYRATITTYTKVSAPADRCVLDINWGDGTTSTLKRSNGTPGPSNPCQNEQALPGVPIGNDVRKNVYTGTHTYNASGAYTLSFEDPNRNAGVNNISNSINVPFYVQSELVISPGIGGNSSPILSNPPIDDGCVNEVFKHNPGAYDAEGDSLSFRLVPCRTTGGTFINTTYDPQFVQDSIKINPRTGDLIWDVPQNAGQFNFAFEITEWRQDGNGNFVSIGYIVRDMQVTIEQCPAKNKPPVLPELGPFCVEAGQFLNFNFQASDPDGDPITLRAFGGPFEAKNDPPPNPNPSLTANNGSNPANGVFNWRTQCRHVRKQPYFLTLEAKDDPSGRSPNLPRLVDLTTVEIRVVAPAPKNPTAIAEESAIELNWDPSICSKANAYKIYRREESYGFVPSECETGVPEYTGYELIDTTQGLFDTNYVDSLELKRGVSYCYMVVACFPDDSESYASVEFCASLPLTFPMMTNVDIIQTDSSNGVIDVKWIYPPDFDSTLFPPPYNYKLYRADGIDGTDFAEIQSTADTFYTDSNLNTAAQGYAYQVELYYGSPTELLGRADPASSIFLDVAPGDRASILRYNSNTPWRNDFYTIFRETPTGSGNFVNIDTSFGQSYTDTGLVNGETYCYKVLGSGAYTASDSLPAPLLNNSQEQCSSPIDTDSPCAPVLDGTFVCERDSLYLTWEYPTNSNCAQDVMEYRIYYKESAEDEFETVYATIPVGSNNSISLTEMPVIGCYAVTAVDDAANDPNGMANESPFSNIVCAEPCPLIEFPNVFTPNGDEVNDFFTAIDYRNIGELTIRIFNRNGTLVYETNQPEQFFNPGWDGTDMTTGRLCSDGVYFYVCQYTPQTLGSPRPQEVSGFIHLFAETQ